MNALRQKVGQLLVSQRVLSPPQLERAVAYHEANGCRLGDAAVALGLCTPGQIARALAEQNGMPFADLEVPPPRQILKLIPVEVAREFGVVPVSIENKRLLVAARNPFDIRLDAILSRHAGMPVVMAAAAQPDLEATLTQYEQLLSAARPTTLVKPWAEHAAPGSAEADTASARAAELLELAFRRSATEVRLVPDASALRVQGRIDGQIVPLSSLPLGLGRAVLRSFKRVCGMIAEQEKMPQENSGQIDHGGVACTFQARTVPGHYGETLTLQLAPCGASPRPLEELGFDPSVREEVHRLLRVRPGVVLVGGVAGSGVTTALYSLHRLLVDEGLSAFTVEPEVEARLPGCTQIPAGLVMKAKAPEALRTVREHGPDLVLVDGGWSPEAAGAVQDLVEDGALVLLGLRGVSIPGLMDTYLDAAENPRRAANLLSGVLSLRLSRTVCDQCGDEYLPSEEAADVLAACLADLDGARFRKGLGCDACFYTGFRGRTGLQELLTLDDDLRYLVGRRVLPSLLERNLRKRNPRTMLDDAAWKAAAGVVSPEEVLGLGRKQPQRDPFESLGVSLMSLQAMM